MRNRLKRKIGMYIALENTCIKFKIRIKYVNDFGGIQILFEDG